ncbi:MAG TPA: ATP-dependent DNA helicase RecG [Acidimicrobiia bacterium]|nr:ATP-dependent DNA helicase RecG [Acidimicrobiia bacterium]
MTGRSLAYLTDVSVERVKGVGPKLGGKLSDAGIGSVTDLLMHAPRRYIDRSLVTAIADAPVGREVTIVGSVTKTTSRRVRRGLVIVETVVTDGESFLFVTFFNQGWRERQLQPGVEVAVSGKAERFRGRLQMKSPAMDVLSKGEHRKTGRIVPVYPTVAGIASWRLEEMIANALRRARLVETDAGLVEEPIADPLPEDLLDRLDLVDRDAALGGLHAPASPEEAEAARQRLVFDELFRLEVALALRKRRQIDEAEGIAHEIGTGLVEAFLEGLPFEPTGAQRRAIDDVRRDMAVPHPMHRLLQGDVGSGKTVVAMAALLVGVQGGYQGAVMAPTEVLAEQHFLNLEPLAAIHGVRMALLTGSSKDRAEALSGVADGTIDIVVGTHALIQEGVHFHRLGIAVVDEQHRFGVHQRVQLREKAGDLQPDLLIMTATPIPRTLSMTLYGDLDVSVLDEMPAERPEVRTVAVAPGDVERVYDTIREQAALGRLAYVVCPLVEDSDKLEAASATAEHVRLSKEFPDLEVGLLHGQMRPDDKRSVMARFRDREIQVLVCTTVIEVGIDVKDSTVMVIEDADRFGLSQLHQLRGRLSRGVGPNWCFLVADPQTDDGRQRIAAMVDSDDGFRLAEVDLEIRGQGTVFGDRQAGAADLRLADLLRDLDTLVTARREAFALVADDPRLDRHAELAAEIRSLLGDDIAWLFIS